MFILATTKHLGVSFKKNKISPSKSWGNVYNNLNFATDK